MDLEAYFHALNLYIALYPYCSWAIDYKQILRIGMLGLVSDVWEKTGKEVFLVSIH